MASPLQNLSQDIRFALRQLRRSPGFAVTAILTIALGIGANTAIFTLAHAILLRELPVTDPKSLYRIGDKNDCCINGGMPGNQDFSIFSTEEYRTLRDGTKDEFEELAAMPAGGGNGTSLAKRADTDEAARHLQGSYVSGNYFHLFQLKPERGRLLTVADDREGAPPVAVMSYSAWAQQYNSDPSVVGATFLLDSKPVTIVGIAPSSFYGDRVRANPPAFYQPIANEGQMVDKPIGENPQLHWLYILGRIRPGVNAALLQQKVSGILRGYEATQKSYQSEEGRKEIPKVYAVLVPAPTGIPQMQQQVRRGIHILLGISGLVLLIACGNIANLLLARGTTRYAETAMRVALGAARSRILLQTLTECIVLALLGGLAGVVLAFFGARAMLALAFPEATRLPISASPSVPVLLFTFAVSVLTGLLFGVGPAIAATKAQPADALRGLNRSSAGKASLPQRSLVVMQAMLSLVLITVAALLTRSLSNLQHQNFGLETQDRIVVHIDPVASGYKTEQMVGLMRSMQDRLAGIPGIKRVGFADYSPLEGNNWGEGVFIEGRPDPALHDDIFASWVRVSPGFFASIGQPLLRGRDFTIEDRDTTTQVAVVNQAFVRKFYPHDEPLGKRFGTDKHNFEYMIVGIVGDAKYQDMAEAPHPMFFRSITQIKPNPDPKDMGETYSLAPHAILLQASGASAGYEQQIRRALQDVNPNLAITDLRSMDSQVAGQLSDEHMVVRLTAAFGVLALVLASIGLYGVTAYSVAQRVPEIGLRMALGSDRVEVMSLVLRSALVQTGIGLLLGVPAALLAGHSLQAQLYGIQGHDALTLLAACFVLGISALIASAVPARRASAIEPMRALRAE